MSKHAYMQAYPEEFREQVVNRVQVGDWPGPNWPVNSGFRGIQCSVG